MKYSNILLLFTPLSLVFLSFIASSNNFPFISLVYNFASINLTTFSSTRNYTLRDWRVFFTGTGNLTKIQTTKFLSLTNHSLYERKKPFIKNYEQIFRNYSYVRKTAFSVHKQIVFFAGLEGSGHTFLKVWALPKSADSFGF